jgi:ABC-type transport system involved in cytochrome c biogenesis permease subunit
LQTACFWTAVALYALGTGCGFVGLAFGSPRAEALAVRAGTLALVPHAGALALRWAEVGHGPYNTRYEVASAEAFLIVALWMVGSRFARGLRPVGAFVLPLAVLAMGWALGTFALRSEVPIIFRSPWLWVHIGFAKAFGACTIVAGACAAAHLAKAARPERFPRLPAAEDLDLYAHHFLLVAFLFLGVMIAAGALWAHQSWGRYWGWDPIETSALTTWIGFGVILHFRVLHGWSGRRMAYLTLAAFGLAMVTLYVVAIVVPTIHDSYLVGR